MRRRGKQIKEMIGNGKLSGNIPSRRIEVMSVSVEIFGPPAPTPHRRSWPERSEPSSRRSSTNRSRFVNLCALRTPIPNPARSHCRRNRHSHLVCRLFRRRGATIARPCRRARVPTRNRSTPRVAERICTLATKHRVVPGFPLYPGDTIRVLRRRASRVDSAFPVYSGDETTRRISIRFSNRTVTRVHIAVPHSSHHNHRHIE